ncbi:type IX secretion system membrane protein PorP/SprF [Pseudarcicella hirudinis]|uniref:type IX secretion system membrane protein PorP/SprF n=1 Tax=Pseudarcicella hirudinis TaxID=1079859 RepID=UPI0035EBB6D8
MGRSRRGANNAILHYRYASEKGKKVGLGLQAYNDKAGDISNTGVYLTYAYRVKVSEKKQHLPWV